MYFCAKWGQSAAFQTNKPDQSTLRIKKKKHILFSHSVESSSGIGPLLTSGQAPGPFLSQCTKSMVTLKETATFMSPITNDKQMADCWSIVPLKLLLLSSHLLLAVMKRKNLPIVDISVLKRFDVSSPRMSDLGTLGQAVMATGIDRTGFMDQCIGRKCSQRMVLRRRTRSSIIGDIKRNHKKPQ